MKVTRFSIIAALALGSLLACSTVASAQDNSTSHKGQRRAIGLQERVDKLSTDLQLTADQKSKISALFQKERQSAQEIRKDTSLTRDQRREKTRALHADNNKELKAILTPEQFTKYQTLQREMRSQRQGGAAKKSSQ